MSTPTIASNSLPTTPKIICPEESSANRNSMQNRFHKRIINESCLSKSKSEIITQQDVSKVAVKKDELPIKLTVEKTTSTTDLLVMNERNESTESNTAIKKSEPVATKSNNDQESLAQANFAMETAKSEEILSDPIDR